MEVDKTLVSRVQHRVTAANVHAFNNLLQSYYTNITWYNMLVEDGRPKELVEDQERKVRSCEVKLRFFK